MQNTMGRLASVLASSVVIGAASLSLGVWAAPAASLGGPMELQDEGSFFIGGQVSRSSHPSNAVGFAAGQIMTNQMYVHYRIPKTISAPPIVMVHGSGHTGVTYETTPDGREGWATYFTRKNFAVYVVDHSGRGRSGFDPTPINRAKAETNVAPLPDIPLTTRERAWQNFRFGDVYPTPYVDMAKNNRNRVSTKRAAVRLLSMHTAKGLEFPCVAIAGLGLLGRHGEPVEECVRLTYVGVTRATHEALLTYSSQSALVQRLIA